MQREEKAGIVRMGWLSRVHLNARCSAAALLSEDPAAADSSASESTASESRRSCQGAAAASLLCWSVAAARSSVSGRFPVAQRESGAPSDQTFHTCRAHDGT